MKVWTKVFLCYFFSLGYIYANPILKRTFVEDEEYTKHIVEKIDNIKSITKDIDENRPNNQPQAAEEDKSAEDDTVPTAGEQQNESLTLDPANAASPSPTASHSEERRLYHSDSLKPLIRQLLPPNTTMPTTVQTGANAEKDDWAKYSKEEVQPTNPEVDMTPGDSSPSESVATDTERKEDVKETAGEVKQEENLKKENPEDERELEHSPTEATISFEAKDDGKAPENADTGSALSTESTKHIQEEKGEQVGEEMKDVEMKDISQPTPEPTQEQEIPKVQDHTTTPASSTTESSTTESPATTTPMAFMVTNPPYPGMEEEIQDYGDEEQVSLWHKIILGIRCARQDCRDALVPTPANLKRIMNKWSVTRKAKRVMSAPLNETTPSETLAETMERLKQNCNCKT
ncbi:hypothetical protein DdX_18407 [Ditylenchus destructor]|uniref:Uncharacterized protein n=1 Tax=Ditylenchus destructor TaxID=166010 RepID=A0AAD4QY47_9BILA|nr:hypothetical protein DdX_18407 [Ditylenchus destructor]